MGYHAPMLTRRRLLAGAGLTALTVTTLGRRAAGDSLLAITVFKDPT